MKKCFALYEVSIYLQHKVDTVFKDFMIEENNKPQRKDFIGKYTIKSD